MEEQDLFPNKREAKVGLSHDIESEQDLFPSKAHALNSRDQGYSRNKRQYREDKRATQRDRDTDDFGRRLRSNDQRNDSRRSYNSRVEYDSHGRWAKDPSALEPEFGSRLSRERSRSPSNETRSFGDRLSVASKRRPRQRARDHF